MAGTIVVGVDGSSAGQAALRWAADEARRWDARVTAVHAWTYPYVADVSYLTSRALDRYALAADAKAVLADALASALGPERGGVAVDEVVCEGSAAEVLIRAAEGADLLVVGSRGRGGFKGLLLGSVSQQCAHHSPCPVVIVPSPRRG